MEILQCRAVAVAVQAKAKAKALKTVVYSI